jgi:prephenate dehydrogenase
MPEVQTGEPYSIAIVGGMGRMGAMMNRFLSDAGYSVSLIDTVDGPISWELVAEHEVIFLSVPISAVDGVAREIGPLSRKDGVVIDIASLKVGPIKSMLRHCRGEVIGSHPLFGPRFDSMADQIVFVCPARSSRWINWYRAFLEEQRVRVVDIDPKQHDRLMATVQVLRHLMLFCFGRSLMELDYDPSADLPISGQWFSQLVELLDRQLDQPAELYSELSFNNPMTATVVDSFLNSVQEVCSSYKSGDSENLLPLINQLSSYFSSTNDDTSCE